MRRAFAAVISVCSSALSPPLSPAALGQATHAASAYPVGIRQVEYTETGPEHRHLAMAVFYPARMHGQSAKPFAMPFFINLHLYDEAEIAFDGNKHPLVMLSHGRGSNPLMYAWLAELLASHGYIVAAPYHHRANSYDSTIAYLANKIWQRAVDVALDISYLLNDAVWGKLIDADRIGVAGHSQGGFTALWIAGARINPDRFLAFQRHWRDDAKVPKFLRDELPIDARPALDVADNRVKAAFAMAPGLIQAFGMDPNGLKQVGVPT